MTLNLNISLNVPLIERNVLYVITISGILINLLTMIYLLIITTNRMKSSCFLFHHCIICLTLSILCFPYSLSFSNYQIRCDYLANIQVTCVTAQLLNMAAMVASEAYRFEDLIHQEKSNEKINHYQYQLKQSNQSTISCGCLSFGILIIWFSSVILHLGKQTFLKTTFLNKIMSQGDFKHFSLISGITKRMTLFLEKSTKER